MLARVKANGGRTLTPKTDIGEYGFYAYFEDSEGNRVGVLGGLTGGRRSLRAAEEGQAS